jgi:hypothetical protein
MDEHTQRKLTCTNIRGTPKTDTTDRPCIYSTESKRTQLSDRDRDRDRQSETRHMFNTAKGGTSSSMSKADEDIFEGVSYQRNARYYIAGIGPRSTRTGLLNFLKDKGVSVTHCVFFKQKHPGSRRNAKINVSLRDAKIIESPDCWPHGISCRRWLSNKQWETKIAEEQMQNNACAGNDEGKCDVD